MARLQTTWDEFDNDDTYLADGSAAIRSLTADEFFPGEPIIAPPPRRSFAHRLALLVMLGGTGWALSKTEAMWWPWLSAAVADLTEKFEKSSFAITAAKPTDLPIPQTSTPLQPLDTAREVATVPGSEPSPLAAKPETSPETPPPAAVLSEQAAKSEGSQTNLETAALPDEAPDDPLKKRAIAVGLSPQLSHVVLSSLTDTDYRNAKTGIGKALAKTLDSEKFVFPEKPAGKQAVFQIHFVTGDQPDCRRYVVTIVKNGWTTTAPPVEKCGISKPQSAAASASVYKPSIKPQM